MIFPFLIPVRQSSTRPCGTLPSKWGFPPSMARNGVCMSFISISLLAACRCPRGQQRSSPPYMTESDPQPLWVIPGSPHAGSGLRMCYPNMCLGGQPGFCQHCVSVMDRDQSLSSRGGDFMSKNTGVDPNTHGPFATRGNSESTATPSARTVQSQSPVHAWGPKEFPRDMRSVAHRAAVIRPM